jgi:hypothetical protein
MIPYRPVAPLTLGPRKGWKSVLAAVVMAALLGTTATAVVAAEAGTPAVSASAPAAEESAAKGADRDPSAS